MNILDGDECQPIKNRVALRGGTTKQSIDIPSSFIPFTPHGLVQTERGKRAKGVRGAKKLHYFNLATTLLS